MGTRADLWSPGRFHARLERGVDAGVREFFEVAVRDDSLLSRTGEVGSDGVSSDVRVFTDAAGALAEGRALVAGKVDEGFIEVIHVVGEHARNLALEEAILKDPENPSGYLVYADWLQENGDPRGELVVLDHQLEHKTHNARLLRARRRLEREHRERLLPGRVHEMHRLAQGDGAFECVLARRYGFLREAHLGSASRRLPYTVREILLALLHHPSAALLHSLRIGSVAPVSAPEPAPEPGVGAGTEQGASPGRRPQRYEYQPVIGALAQAAPRCLRRLALADFDQDGLAGAVVVRGLDELFAAMPWLTDIRVSANDIQLGEIVAPALRRFELETGDAPLELLDAIDRAHWPALEELRLDCRDRPLDIGALARSLSGKGVPALRTLALTRTRDTGEILHELLGAPLLREIRVLDLSYGDLSDNDVAAMREQKDAFRSLEALVLDGNFISRAARADVREVFAEASLAGQRGAAAERPRFHPQDIIEFAPDYASIVAARDVAQQSRWRRIATWGRVVWGEYMRTKPYDVFVEVRSSDDMEAGCTCPSQKYPCKHALGLLMLVESFGGSLVAEPPPGFIDKCRASRAG